MSHKNVLATVDGAEVRNVQMIVVRNPATQGAISAAMKVFREERSTSPWTGMIITFVDTAFVVSNVLAKPNRLLDTYLLRLS